jgi:hypothetical protein
VQTYDAINPVQTDIYLGTVEDNEIGNIAVDPKTGDVSPISAAACCGRCGRQRADRHLGTILWC